MNSLFEAEQRRKLRGLARRVEESNRALNAPGYHVDGARDPRAFTRIYGPIGLIRPSSRTDESDPDPSPAVATLVDPSAYITPNYPGTANIIVGSQTNFWWCNVHVSTHVSWTYTSAGPPLPQNPMPAGYLFDSAVTQNGGAIVLNNWTNTPQFGRAGTLDRAITRPRFCCDIDLYDLTRGRSVTDGRMGIETLVALEYGHKNLPAMGLWESGTEIEPRIYVTECNMSQILVDFPSLAEAASVAVWLTITFGGHLVPA